MHRFLVAFCLLALCACSPQQSESAAGCARTASHEVAWTDASAPDTITARSEGPSCAQAVVTLTARKANGDPLWAFAATYFDLTAGGVPPEGAPAVSDEQMDTFLEGWANVTVTTAGTLPEWREGVATLSESAATFSYDTPFDRETYEMLRGRDGPMVCYASAVEGTQCMIVDPLSNTPIPFVAYGP